MTQTSDFKILRQNMIDNQLKKRGVKNEDVLSAMMTVPRHSFISAEYQHLAYKDSPLPIGYRQTISQPFIVAYMLEALNLENPSTAKVLEVGTGLGYQAAVLSRFVAEVYSVERITALALQAKQSLTILDYTNVTISKGDGGYGWRKHAPYDGIVVAAAAPEIPAPLLDQLKIGATMVIPVGESGKQMLKRVTRTDDNHFKFEDLIPVAFVPLIGEHGFGETQNH